MRDWLKLVKAGDALLLLLLAIVTGFSFPLLWQGGFADRAIIRQGGQVFAELDLHARRTVQVPGPLGTTTIVIEPGRARVAADPGIRQYCVRQGWLERPGEIAICAPNQVSLAISGRARAYDTLSY